MKQISDTNILRGKLSQKFTDINICFAKMKQFPRILIVILLMMKGKQRVINILTVYFIYTTGFTLTSFYSVNILGSQICALPLNIPILIRFNMAL